MPQPTEDRFYYLTRMEGELALARSAPHPKAAMAHSILAGLYLDRVRSAAEVAHSQPTHV